MDITFVSLFQLAELLSFSENNKGREEWGKQEEVGKGGVSGERQVRTTGKGLD